MKSLTICKESEVSEVGDGVIWLVEAVQGLFPLPYIGGLADVDAIEVQVWL